MRIERSIPYFKALLRAPVNKRKSILHSFPNFVADDIVEVLYNLLNQNVPLPTRHKKRLKASEKRVVQQLVARAMNRKDRRRLIYKQSGGFLGAILPLIASIVGSIVTNAAS